MGADLRRGTLGVGGFITVPAELPYDGESMIFIMGPTGMTA